MAMAVHEPTDLVCTPKWQIMFLGFRQQWCSNYLHYETARHSARVTGALWESVYHSPGYVMVSWNAVMEVMRRAAGDVHNTNSLSSILTGNVTRNTFYSKIRLPQHIKNISMTYPFT